jgi:hypothetical protein
MRFSRNDKNRGKREESQMVYYERPDSYYIPDNLNDGRTFFHIPNRNLIETVVLEIAMVILVKSTPFIATIKLSAGIILGVALGIVGIFGIKNESLTEFIISTIRFKKARHAIHFRKCNEEIKDEIEENETTNPGDLLRRIEDAGTRRYSAHVTRKGQKENEILSGQTGKKE